MAVAESMLAKVERLRALRALRGQLKVEAANAWAAYYRACNRAEEGAPDPATGGIPAEVQANIERLGAWAEAVEAEYRRVFLAEEALAGEILGLKQCENEAVPITFGMVAQAEVA